jgi:hypothetical protein
MFSVYQIFLLILSLCFAVFNSRAIADEIEQKEARLNMGYYFKTISEYANRADIEISLNFWARELLMWKPKNIILQSPLPRMLLCLIAWKI